MSGCCERPSKKTLYEYLRDRAAANPDGIMFYGKESLSFGQVLRLVGRRVACLTKAGIRERDVLALRADRNADVSVMILALISMGAAVILEDPRCASRAFWEDSSAAAVRGFLAGQDGDWKLYTPDGERLLREDETAAEEMIVCDPFRPALMIRTSGSEGVGKLVVLNQYNLVNCLTDVAPRGDYRPGDVALGVLPLSHVFGMVLLFGTVILDYGIAYPEELTVSAVLQAVKTFGITRINSVPSFYKQLAEAGSPAELESLRVGFIGGAPCTPEELAGLEEKLGMKLLNVYGMTECVSICCCDAREPDEIRTRGVGRAYDFSTVRVVSEDGTVCLPGDVGEICVKGPSLMLGYYQDPQATREAVDEEGFLHTGDLGFADMDGIVTVTGRKKDIIICNGVNISARRVELALLEIPGIREAAVVSLPDDRRGEVPGAVVVSELAPDRILEALRGKLPKNELPELILPIPRLPLTTSGKIDKIGVKKLLMR